MKGKQEGIVKKFSIRFFVKMGGAVLSQSPFFVYP